ncbi:MAG TPA: GNAT family N-acetyltransferase [Aggregatilineales bacterium]|nr:GNAT family N-acetyltransferase [Aggregatilineales bacterium]
MLRKARPEDIEPMRQLIQANLDKLLPRTADELQELQDMAWVVEEDGQIVGCCILEIYSPKIAELRSLAVREDCRSKGYGEILVKAAVEEAQKHKVRQVLVVTSSPEFFQKQNFGACLDEKYALFWMGNSGDKSN